jgi:soluble cytochrome b562
MLVYKVGSKGKPVEQIQKDLNNLSCKPKLEVDGIFGPNTKKAVIHFQKRCKIKTDGVIGPITTAAIQYGGPLPELPGYSSEKLLGMVKDADCMQNYNKRISALIKSLDDTTNTLDAALNKSVPAAAATIKANIPLWKQHKKNLTELAKIKKSFEDTLIADPKKAEAIAKQYKTVQKKYGDVLDQMDVNRKKLEDAQYAAFDAVSAAIPKLQKCVKEMNS